MGLVPFLHSRSTKFHSGASFCQINRRKLDCVLFRRRCSASDHAGSLYLRAMRQLQLLKIRQQFDRARLEDPRGALRAQLPALDSMIRPNATIAIAAGSRGIDNLAGVVTELGEYLRARGARPFVDPAMGSHGG